jgi:hypothetical protein
MWGFFYGVNSANYLFTFTVYNHIMRKFYFLVFVFCFGFTNAQIINFPDANFKAKLLTADVTNNTAQIDGPGSSITNVKIDSNNNGEIEISEAALIYILNLQNSNISNLAGIGYFTGLRSVDCSNNLLTSLTPGAAGSAWINPQMAWHCEHNQITNVDFTGFVGALFLHCDYNQISSFDFSTMAGYMFLYCSNNPITELIGGDYKKFLGVSCSNTQVTTIDISGSNECEMLIANNNPNLAALMIKDAVDIDPDMGDMWSAFNYSGCPNLQYLCVSDDRLVQAQNKLNSYGYTNCAVNSYCDFNAGSPFYVVQGSNKLDLNNNGCDSDDNPYPHLKLNITNGTINGTIPTYDGSYSISVTSGTHIITPAIDVLGYFTIAPTSLTVTFPGQSSPVTQDFCITPNGNYNDLEISILPTTVARPGFDAHYILICKNKGTTTQDAIVNLAFDDTVADFTSASPAATIGTGNLSWILNQLQPFETRQILVTMNLNTPTETPALNGGDILDYIANVLAAADETPNDNTATLHQTVINSFDPNDKTCLEGNTVGPEMIGQYVHYIIRFENTGTANAENIVVKDMIDTSKFDISTLIPMSGSHPFTTRISETNKAEFIFENINLPFDDANNDGYVAFKIKTKPTLVVGDTFSNNANIYFDYNFPIVTNTATTAIQLLRNPDFAFSDYFTLHPNPVKNMLNIQAKDTIEMQSISIYNLLGQLVRVTTGNVDSIDVSDLKTGNYLIKVYSDKGLSTSKFIKE